MTENSKKPSIPEFIQRWDSHQRYQHILLFSSMIFLFITGFPIKWGHSDWAQYIVNLFGNFNNLFTVHLIAAVIMVFSGLYHIVWLVLHFNLSGPKWSMVPNLKDAKDAYHHALYLLGIRKDPPQYDRYTYLEKFEYLAGGYGIILMGITGYFLWFPEVAAAIMPRWVIHLLRVAHSNEAVVCLLAVCISHFYWVHFNPDVFPTSKVWINGRISRHHEMEEHPLEYERLTSEYVETETTVTEEHHQSKYTKSRFLIIFELTIYIAIISFVYFKMLPKLFS